MRQVLDMMKLFSDESRLRIFLLLDNKELCVCQIMGVLGMSQPLVSRNLSLLLKAGFLRDRREGKLMFYRVKKTLPGKHRLFLSAINELLKGDNTLKKDLRSLRECTEFQKESGRCDMDTLKAFMKHKSGRQKTETGKQRRKP